MVAQVQQTQQMQQEQVKQLYETLDARATSAALTANEQVKQAGIAYEYAKRVGEELAAEVVRLGRMDDRIEKADVKNDSLRYEVWQAFEKMNVTLGKADDNFEGMQRVLGAHADSIKELEGKIEKSDEKSVAQLERLE